METFDYVIIGSGSAAMAGATKAGELGAKTAIIERAPVVGREEEASAAESFDYLRRKLA